MKFLTNPVLLRAVVVLFLASFGFVMGLIFIRLLRKSIHDEATIDAEPAHSLETLQLNVYNTVIQQLKEQKNELDAQSKADQQRARVNETISQSVITNLSSGVLIFGTNGLVKSSNPAAKRILGFVSAVGMSADDIFRGALVRSSLSVENTHTHNQDLSDDAVQSDVSGVNDENDANDANQDSGGPSSVADEFDAVLRLRAERRVAHAEYETPAGETRFLAVTISPVPSPHGGLLAVACLIDDLSEIDSILSQHELRGDTSARTAAAGSGS